MPPKKKRLEQLYVLFDNWVDINEDKTQIERDSNLQHLSNFYKNTIQQNEIQNLSKTSIIKATNKFQHNLIPTVTIEDKIKLDINTSKNFNINNKKAKKININIKDENNIRISKFSNENQYILKENKPQSKQYCDHSSNKNQEHINKINSYSIF